MRTEKQEASNLRKNGKSYKEIYDTLGIPKSTLSDWFRNEDWSKKITKYLNKESAEESVKRLVILNRQRRVHLADLYIQAREEAEEEFYFFKK